MQTDVESDHHAPEVVMIQHHKPSSVKHHWTETSTPTTSKFPGRLQGRQRTLMHIQKQDPTKANIQHPQYAVENSEYSIKTSSKVSYLSSSPYSPVCAQGRATSCTYT
ncbi:hypothetical protein J1614_003456 [Plenodomus biglobosus]|nr:hypothetical protein J1614_003456 [Plenodomus biglobosus]